MVLLVADLNVPPHGSGARPTLLHLAKRMETPSSHLRVISTPLLMQFKGKFRTHYINYFWVKSPPLGILKCQADVALRDMV